MRQFRNFSAPKPSAIPEDIVREATEKYRGMDEDALITQLMSMVADQKRAGTFDIAQLRTMIDSVSAFLTPEQHSKINNILAIIQDEQS